ncbi:hypothetical protein BV898_13561 [Hypsibius exemplaris]|uniref:Glycine zipper domain-containing protein n=1 Tax=Hypsibius exemplaris TaxID=2072580 RepID=A0A1W0WAB4_HYPEX|nr:hypothetical protein BV898_13561 [Hypsibius exemplaris]
MNGYSCFLVLLVLSVASANVLRSDADNELIREKRGIISGGIKGALLGGLAGAVLPGVSAGTGAKAGAVAGAGLGLLKRGR